ncbi:MAG TPA: TonB-dependent receptor [Gemmatimonadaceae bacterium]|nr:TonB-dependent receptor [Gemmatimonadaceae bacterium]
MKRWSSVWSMASLLALAAGMLAPSTAAAQSTATVRGTVTDSATGTPIADVQVVITGTTRGALTNATGQYILQNVAPGNITVRTQMIGYAPSERQVTANAGDTTVVDFSLRATAVVLGQVVVVGYGTQNRSQVTGAVTRVTGADVANTPIASVDAALQGKAPGVQITQNSGDPGNGITVRVRGAASVSASNQPLYVIDGVPMQSEDFAQLGPNAQGLSAVTGLDPNEIESITVLKDAASAAIYGSRGSNGVVMITTKRGQQGRTRFTFNAYTGWQTAAKKLDLMNAQQYVDYMNKGADNDGETEPFDSTTAAVNTDWQSAVFRTAPVSNVHLDISGGNDRVTYSVGGTYFDQQGIVKASSYKRASGRVNLDFDATDKLRLSTSIGLSHELDNRVTGDNSLDGVVTNAIGMQPFRPVYQSDGSFADKSSDGLKYSNPVAIAALWNLPTTTNRVLGNVKGDYAFTPHLTLTGRVGADVINVHELQWQSPLVGNTYAAGAGGVSKDGYNTGNKYVLESFLTYARGNEEASNISVVGGASLEYNKDHLNFIRGEGFPSPQFHFVENAAVITDYDGISADHNLESFFARANYSYKDRYLLSASLRTDGSSRFGANNRWGVFPAVSAGWVISEEPFMGDFGRRLGTFKLRASYGVTGNQSIPNYASFGTFTSANYGTTAGIAPGNFANPDLKWESTKEFDAGFDWLPFGGRLSVIADYYHKLTSNLLVDRPIPATSGYTTYLSNVGNVVNEGFELGLSSTNIAPSSKGGFGWQTDFNISTNRNEVTKLFDNQPFGDNANFRPISHVAVGQPIGEFYVLHFTGVDPQTGDAVYQDVDGDGSITSADRVNSGSPQPKFWGGLGNTFSWKGLELYGFFEFSEGAKVFNLMRIFADDGGCAWDNKFAYALTAWQKPGDITDEPRASYDCDSGADLISSRFIEDGSYIRLQNVTLSWHLPTKLTSLPDAKLYISGHNLVTFTRYTGYDPDVNSNGSDSNIALGTDYYAYPRARTISIGVSSSW